ncbi:unnamed protein product, partial [Gulo gulo]
STCSEAGRGARVLTGPIRDQEEQLSSLVPSPLPDNLTEVQALVEQVKEKTANIQALAHSTVGQTLPTPLKKLFPSIISITWPLLFFEYEGSFIQVCGMRGNYLC